MTDLSIYKNLADYFISAPLSALLTVLLGLSMSVVFDEAGKAVFKRNELWMRAMYFFTGLLITSWMIWLFGLLHYINQPLLIVVAGAFILIAFFIALKKGKRLFFKEVFQAFKIGPVQNRKTVWLQYLGIATLLIFFCISLAPPTDADSLDYHLGIPVEMLRTGSLWYDIHNLHFRLAGFGEMLNLLGVANGCVQLGAFLQMLALLWLIVVYIEAMPQVLKPHVYALVLGIPILLFFIPGQKHQLTGIAATATCFFILCFQKQHFTKQVIILWVCTLLFAAGIKYSFIISAAALLLYALLQVKNKGSILVMIAVLACIFLAPVFSYKYFYFGDALSPVLERFKTNPDPAVMGLGRFLRNFRDPGFGFPAGIFLPASFGSISVTMGWCAVVLLFAFSLFRQYWRECTVVLLFIVLTISFGQKTARFFVEPYLWMLPIVLLNAANQKTGRYVLKIGIAQFLLLLPFIAFSFYLLAPGIVSGNMREKVLVRSAYGYAESRWLDKVLPQDARIAANLRSRAWFPRPFFPKEYLYLSMKDSTRAIKMDSMLKAYRINYFVLENNIALEKFKAQHAGSIIAGPEKFTLATRNPFNSIRYELVVYKLK